MGKWTLLIERAGNGYILTGQSDTSEQDVSWVIEDDRGDELTSHENLLWEVMEYFSFGGTKHDPERIRITRIKRES